MGGGATNGTWSGGSGTFHPNATTLDATYQPSPEDITFGEVALTLTSDGQQGPCGKPKRMCRDIHAPPAISGQPIDRSVPATVPATFCVTATGGVLTYQWQLSSNGGTTFTNIPAATNACYTEPGPRGDRGRQSIPGHRQWRVRSVGDLHAAGGAACGRPDTAYAGPNQTVCASSPATQLAGEYGAGATTGATWSGAGAFLPDHRTMNAVYTPTESR